MAVADNIRGDTKFMRLAVLLEPEIARMLDGQAARTGGFEDAQFDASRNIVSYVARNQLLWEARAEIIGSYLPDFGLWRWWWTGRMTQSMVKCSMDLAFSEGQRHSITALTTEHPRIALEDDAVLLANVCAHLARADGMFRTRDDEKITYYALFDTGRAKRHSVMPGSMSTKAAGSMRPPAAGSSPPQRAASPTIGVPSMSPVQMGAHSMGAPAMTMQAMGTPSRAPTALPPDMRLAEPKYSAAILDDPFDPSPQTGRHSTVPREPSTSTKMQTVASIPPTGAHRAAAPIREPAREIFLPLVQIAFGAIHTAFPNGFHQALLVLNVDIYEGKARFSAIIVASGENHDLVVVDSPRELVDAAAKMISEDARSGNGRWRRLTARLSRTQRGASVDVSVA